MSWATPYIGIPWVAGKSDCWAIARRIWREVFGLDVPTVDVDAHSRLETIRAFGGHQEYANWHIVATPMDGDAVLMGRHRNPSHVGVWCASDGGGIVHSLEKSCVVFTKPGALPAMGLRVIAYYRRND